MEPLLAWLEEHADRDLTLDDIAARAGTSTRTLNRRFREQTGTTPLQWLHRARIRRAQYLLENTPYPVERIARQAGFGSPTAFRDRFKRVVGTSPHAYRRAFRGGDATDDTARVVTAPSSTPLQAQAEAQVGTSVAAPVPAGTTAR
jgi:transcriptional regulator GlxA family with amidase domain